MAVRNAQTLLMLMLRKSNLHYCLGLAKLVLAQDGYKIEDMHQMGLGCIKTLPRP